MVALTRHASGMQSLVLCIVAASTVLRVSAVPVHSPDKAMAAKPTAQRSPPVLPLPAHVDSKRFGKSNSGGGSSVKHKEHNKSHPRSSIYLPNEQGSPFVILGARDYHERGQEVLHVRSRARRCLRRRQDADASGIPGRIDVVSFSNSSTDGTKLASLQIASTESKVNSPFILNASNGDQPTAFNLMPDDNGTVSLMTMVYDKSKGTMQKFCANYDPTPPKPRPMTLAACQALSGQSSATGLSQKFRYNNVTGELTPIWAVAANNHTSNTQPGQNVTASSNSDIPTGAAAANSTQANSKSVSTRDIQSPQSVDRVALVFTPSVPIIYEEEDDSDADSGDSSSSVAASSAAMSTTSTSSEINTITITASSVATPSPSTSSSTTESVSNPFTSHAISSGALDVEIATPSPTPTTTGTASSTLATGSTTSSAPSPDDVAASIADNSFDATKSSSSAAMTTTGSAALVH